MGDKWCQRTGCRDQGEKTVDLYRVSEKGFLEKMAFKQRSESEGMSHKDICAESMSDSNPKCAPGTSRMQCGWRRVWVRGEP